MFNLLSSFTTPNAKEEKNPESVTIRVTPDMTDADIIRQVRSSGGGGSPLRLSMSDLDGGGTAVGKSDTRAFYQSPDSALNSVGEAAGKRYNDSLLDMSRSTAKLNETMTNDKNMESARKRFKAMINLEIDTIMENIVNAANYTEQQPEALQVSLLDVVAPRGDPVVSTFDWTIGKARSTCFVPSADGSQITTVECLGTIRVGLDDPPEVIKKRNRQFVEVLKFLLWKADCPSIKQTSRIEPYWNTRITKRYAEYYRYEHAL